MSGSWQSYVDDGLMGDGTLRSGAMIGFDGGTLASTSGFTLNAGEGPGLVALFNDSGSAFASGITVAGTKYMTIKADGQSVYGKKSVNGVCLAKTNTAVIVGYYDGQQQPGTAGVSVEKIADYLRENGL